MQIAWNATAPVCAEREVYEKLLELDGKRLIELGCGAAEQTRALASQGPERHIVGFEVDERQHAKNLQSEYPANVEFRYGGAEAIACPDSSVDAAFMFKSLHHVPVGSMPRALQEVARVLRPGGHAYISEPVFDGAFNEIIRLFHDESAVRKAAFEALREAVASGLFDLEAEIFFRTPVVFRDFGEFEQRIIGATHTDHRLSNDVYEEVRARFGRHAASGGAAFDVPMRVDLLVKSGA